MLRVISKSKYSKVVSSAMAFIIFFNNIIFPTRAMALTGGPTQAEFNSFDPAGASEMVNLFTGDFSYNIPLMDVDGYPVNIAYHGSPSMDQEASWVGLGWNINAGAINRGMRGLPDDFNGDPVKREINMKPYEAWGVGIGGFGELVGANLPINLSNQQGIGVFHSNYSGFGIELSNSSTFGASAGGQAQGGLTAGLGVKINSQDGMDIYPQVGISAKMERNSRSTSVGVNIGCAINSREGLKNVYGGFSISSQEKGGKVKGNDPVTNSHGSNTPGLGFGASASIPGSSQGFAPKVFASMESQAYNLDFKIGGNTCVYGFGGSINGYYAKTKIVDSQTSKDYSAYGYLNSQNADDDAMLDFNREKDGMIYPELPNMPIANYTYDMFSASAQGLNYAFRPYRNDVGNLRDNSTQEASFGLGVGAEVMFSTDINVGINVNVMFSKGKAGRWVDENDFNIYSTFTHDRINDNYEAAYFKVAGEKHSDDAAFLTSINANDEPVQVDIDKISNTKYKATDKLVSKNGTVVTLSSAGPLTKNKRALRNQLVSSLNAFEASKFGLEKDMYSYSVLTPSSFSPSNFDNVILKTSSGPGTDEVGEFMNSAKSNIRRDASFSGYKQYHLSEVTVTQDNGSRYVYGIPMYNRKQTDATFAIGAESTYNSGALDGMQSYTPNVDNNISSVPLLGNEKGIDNYVEKRTLNDYSHGFLLTSIISSDYVDRSGNGPSADDYGDYTKFNYSRVAGEATAYKWRIPVDQNKANFNQGLLADTKDNKGAYLYGEKDLWYMQSIETKNYVAFFVLNDPSTDYRQDAYSVDGENGGVVSGNSNKSRFLKEIRLYAKKDFMHGGIANAKPIKVVHFSYDYSLCGNTANSKAAGIHGKMVLKKIWFTYGNSEKGQLSPYEFKYADFDHNGSLSTNETTYGNPDYNQSAIDRWGMYKANTGGARNNLDFPYVDQAGNYLNMQAAAWSLTDIFTPAGSHIKVNYEADDYAYVQNKEAGQMFFLRGLSNSTDANIQTDLYGNNYLIVDLKPSGAAGIPAATTGSAADAAFNAKYIKGLEKIYFRAKVLLDGTNKEFVPGYADIHKAGICTNNSTYNVNGTAYHEFAYILLKTKGVNDKNQGAPQINDIVKASMQMGRMYLPQIAFPGSQPASGAGGSAVLGLVTSIKDARYFLQGVNRALYARGFAQAIDIDGSVVRLYNPGGNKKGGGARVSKIAINDAWQSMSGESDSEYGQEYSYTTQRNGETISSGVASYEPLLGGDENSMRYPVNFAINKVFAPNDEYFQEEPMGESFFPDPVVGYSKVTVKNIAHANVKAHATGRTEYEFYTAKDFPVITDRTPLQKQRVKPKLLKSILKFGATDKLYLSQGYLIKTNDMHGKPKSQKMFAEGSNSAISGVIYHYKTKTGPKGQELDGQVDVIDKTNTVSQKTIGKTTDFYSDSRSAENDTYTAGIGINVNSATCTYYVPLVFVWPSFGQQHREFKSMGTTKLVQQYGLIDYVEAFENNSTVKTKNLLYDEVTGGVVLTETINNFEAPIYNLSYQAYWAYEDMGAAFANAGIRFNPTVMDGITPGKISSTTYFRPGDEVGIFDNEQGEYIKTWVVKTGAGLFLVDIDGAVYDHIANLTFNNMVGSAYVNHLKILRSGRRNVQSAPMASMLSLANPISSNQVNAGTNTKVINASAVEYSNEWHLIAGDNKGEDSCGCTPNSTMISNLSSALSYIVSNNLHNAPAYPVTVWNKFNNSPGTCAPQLLGLIQSLSIFNECDKVESYPPSPLTPNRFITMTVTKSIVPNGGQYDHKISIVFTGNSLSGASSCTGTTCPIELTVRKPESTPNFWNSVNFFAFGDIIENTDCTNSNVFTFYTNDPGLAKPDGSEMVAVSTKTGTSCYELTNCSSSSTYVQCGKMIGGQINPYVENIRGNWRVKKSYSFLVNRNQYNQGNTNMNGNIREDGTYTSYLPFWKYSSGAWQPVYTHNSGSYDKWIKNNEVDKITEYGNVLQARDVLNRPSASLYGYNHTLPVAAANNAYYNQLAFDGFEDYDFILNECSADLAGTSPSTNKDGYIEHFNYYMFKSNLSTAQSHTGRFSMLVPAYGNFAVKRKLTDPTPASGADDVPYTIKEIDNAGLFGPYHSYTKAQKFILSVWVKEDVTLSPSSSTPLTTYDGAGVSVQLNGSYVATTPAEKSAIINGWQKLEYIFTVPASTPNSNGAINYGSITVSLKSNSGNAVYYDDIRIHPFNSSMKSMVYDPFSLRLMAELDDRNYATFYEYDEEGTLVRVKKETEKGIYTIKESRSGLKK